MRRCEKCLNFYAGFEVNEDTGAYFDYCKCELSGELLDCTEAEFCVDYEEAD